MNLYNVFGAINTVFIIISLYGVYSQLNTIWQRKSVPIDKQRPTALLSLNQFTISYLAYLSFFIYGYSIEPFNHYIVWPRLIASIIIALILFEIWQDRKSRHSIVSLAFACITLLLALIGLFVGETITDQGKYISTTIILLVSILIAQGYYHQIKLIISFGDTGAVDLKMSQFILMMDISTIAFALTMGLYLGWPLMILAITSAITKIIILFLFKWVKISPTAKKRRTIKPV